MFSFLILITLYFIPVVHIFIRDIKNGNYKNLYKWVIAIILLVIAIYLKSINY